MTIGTRYFVTAERTIRMDSQEIEKALKAAAGAHIPNGSVVSVDIDHDDNGRLYAEIVTRVETPVRLTGDAA